MTFLASVSHEIRAPIAGVLGMARILKEIDLSGEGQDYVESILTSAEHSLSVVNDILDVSKVRGCFFRAPKEIRNQVGHSLNFSLRVHSSNAFFNVF